MMKLHLASMCVAVVLCACSKSDTPEPGAGSADTKMRISTSLNTHLTKADPMPYTGSSLSLSVDYGVTDKYTMHHVKWTGSENGTIWTPEQQTYWKDLTTVTKVYAFAPFTAVGADISALPIEVQTDQSTGTLSSDFVVFRNEAFIPEKHLTPNKELQINFRHAFSMLRVKISFTNQWGDNLPRIKEVRVNGVRTKAVFDAIVQSLSEISAPNVIKTHPVELGYEAILIPQNVAQGTRLVTIHLDNNQIYAYTIGGADGFDFAPNTLYTLSLSVGQNQVDVSDILVDEWGNQVDMGDVESGEAAFSDPAFAEILAAPPYNLPLTFGYINPSDPATRAAIEEIQELNVSSKNIVSLVGIEYFTNLTVLNCGSNKLKELHVKKLTKLKTLYCDNNQLTQLNVSSLAGLTRLNCGYNNLSTLSINKINKLTALHCLYNNLSELDITALPFLVDIWCGNQHRPSGEKQPLMLYLTEAQKNTLALGEANNDNVIPVVK